MAEQPKTHINAAIIAGFIGFIWIVAIILNLLIPPQPAAAPAGEEVPILRGKSITILMHEWGFNQLKQGGPVIEIPAGEEVEIIVRNEGSNLHSWQVKTKDGKKVAGLDKDDTIDPGEELVLTIKIDEPGEYLYICPVAGHEEKGMQGILRVVG